MIRNIYALLVIFIISFQVFSQRVQPEDKKTFAERITFGGNFGLQFGNATMIDLSPNVGYYVLDNVVTGVGITYKYYKYKDYFNFGNDSYDYKINMIGGSIFTSYYIKSDYIEILNNVFFHTEYEPLLLKFDEYTIDPNLLNISVNKRSEWVHSIFVGGGYQQQIGERSSFQILVLWNLNESFYSPYENPVIRIGFNIGY